MAKETQWSTNHSETVAFGVFWFVGGWEGNKQREKTQWEAPIIQRLSLLMCFDFVGGWEGNRENRTKLLGNEFLRILGFPMAKETQWEAPIIQRLSSVDVFFFVGRFEGNRKEQKFLGMNSWEFLGSYGQRNSMGSGQEAPIIQRLSLWCVLICWRLGREQTERKNSMGSTNHSETMGREGNREKRKQKNSWEWIPENSRVSYGQRNSMGSTNHLETVSVDVFFFVGRFEGNREKRTKILGNSWEFLGFASENHERRRVERARGTRERRLERSRAEEKNKNEREEEKQNERES